MHSDPKLSERLRKLFADSDLEERVMFGGIAFFLHGNMCVGVYHDKLILRVGEAAGDKAMARDHVLPFDITGRVMLAWIMIEPAGYITARQLRAWIDKAVTFVETLPRKY